MKKETLVGSLHLLARARAEQAGVKLTIGGARAFTDGQSITIPSLPTDNLKAIVLAMGYLGHEAAHIKHTDFNALRHANMTPFEKSLENSIEDTRIEVKEGESYPGIRNDLNALVNAVAEEGGFAPGPSAPISSLIPMYVNLRLRQIKANQDVCGSLADHIEARLVEAIPAGALVRLEGLLMPAMKANCTGDVIVVAKQIAAMLKEEAEKAEQEKQQQQQQDQQQQDQPQDSDGDADDSGAGQAGDDQVDNQGQGDDSTDDGATDGDGDDSGQSEDSQSDQTNGNSAGQQGDDSDDSASKQSSQNQGKPGGQDLLDALDDQDAAFEGLGEQVAKQLGEASAQAIGKIGNISLGCPMARLSDAALINDVRQATNALNRRISGLIETMSLDSVDVRNKGKKLSGAHLYRLATGDERVFRHIVEGEGVDTALSILLDASTSMNDNNRAEVNARIKAARASGTVLSDSQTVVVSRYDLAKKTAAAVSLAIDGVEGAETEIVSFPTLNHSAMVIKPFDLPLRAVSGVLNSSQATIPSTPMTEALLAAGESLLRRKENRKIMLCLHDGEPNDQDTCRAAVRSLEAMGVEVIGLGIMCDTRHIFERSIMITNLDDMPKAVFGLLESKLIHMPLAA